MRRKIKRNLTLLEAILALSVATATTAIIVPAASGMIQSAKENRVLMELNAIAAGVAEYCRDVGCYPGTEQILGRKSLVLTTEGRYPVAAQSDWTLAQRVQLKSYLNTPAAGAGARWAGPYLSQSLQRDPWGNAYLLTMSYQPDQALFVLSAGPNGIVETGFHQRISNAVAAGDDCIVRLR